LSHKVLFDSNVCHLQGYGGCWLFIYISLSALMSDVGYGHVV